MAAATFLSYSMSDDNERVLFSSINVGIQYNAYFLLYILFQVSIRVTLQ